MSRFTTFMVSALLAAPSLAFALESGDIPRAGKWSSVVEILDNSQNHDLLKTSFNDDPEACMAGLQQTATAVKQSNGYVWTNRDKSTINYESKPETTEKVRVLGLRCVVEPFRSELVRVR